MGKKLKLKIIFNFHGKINIRKIYWEKILYKWLSFVKFSLDLDGCYLKVLSENIVLREFFKYIEKWFSLHLDPNKENNVSQQLEFFQIFPKSLLNGLENLSLQRHISIPPSNLLFLNFLFLKNYEIRFQKMLTNKPFPWKNYKNFNFLKIFSSFEEHFGFKVICFVNWKKKNKLIDLLVIKFLNLGGIFPEKKVLRKRFDFQGKSTNSFTLRPLGLGCLKLSKKTSGQKKKKKYFFFFLKQILKINGDLCGVNSLEKNLHFSFLESHEISPFLEIFFQKLVESMNIAFFFTPKIFKKGFIIKTFSWENFSKEEHEFHTLFKKSSRQYTKRSYRNFFFSPKKIISSSPSSLLTIQILIGSIKIIGKKEFSAFSKLVKRKFFTLLGVGHHLLRILTRKIMTLLKFSSFHDFFLGKIFLIFEIFGSNNSIFQQATKWLEKKFLDIIKSENFLENLHFQFSILGFSKTRLLNLQTYLRKIKKCISKEKKKKILKFIFFFFEFSWFSFGVFFKNLNLSHPIGVFSGNFLTTFDFLNPKSCCFLKWLKKNLKKNPPPLTQTKIQKKKWLFKKKLNQNEILIYENWYFPIFQNIFTQKTPYSLIFSNDKKYLHFSFKNILKGENKAASFFFEKSQKRVEGKLTFTPKNFSYCQNGFCLLCVEKKIKKCHKWFFEKAFDPDFYKKKIKKKIFLIFFYSTVFSTFFRNKFFSKNLMQRFKNISKINILRRTPHFLIFFSSILKKRDISISIRFQKISMGFSFSTIEESQKKYKSYFSRYIKRLFRILFFFRDSLCEIIKQKEKKKIINKSSSYLLQFFSKSLLYKKKLVQQKSKTKFFLDLNFSRIQWNCYKKEVKKKKFSSVNFKFCFFFSGQFFPLFIILPKLSNRPKKLDEEKNRIFLFIEKSKLPPFFFSLEKFFISEQEYFLYQKQECLKEHFLLDIFSKFNLQLNFFLKATSFKKSVFLIFLMKKQSLSLNTNNKLLKKKSRSEIKFLMNNSRMIWEIFIKKKKKIFHQEVFLFSDFLIYQNFGDLMIFYSIRLYVFYLFLNFLFKKKIQEAFKRIKKLIVFKRFIVGVRFSKKFKLLNFRHTLEKKNFLYRERKEFRVEDFLYRKIVDSSFVHDLFLKKRLKKQLKQKIICFIEKKSTTFNNILGKAFDLGLLRSKKITYCFIFFFQNFFNSKNSQKNILEKFFYFFLRELPFSFIFKLVEVKEKFLRMLIFFKKKISNLNNFVDFRGSNFLQRPPSFLWKFFDHFKNKNSKRNNFKKNLFYFTKKMKTLRGKFSHENQMLRFLLSENSSGKITKEVNIFKILKSNDPPEENSKILFLLKKFFEKTFLNLSMKFSENKFGFWIKTISKTTKNPFYKFLFKINYLSLAYLSYYLETPLKISFFRKYIWMLFFFFKFFFSSPFFLFSENNKKKISLKITILDKKTMFFSKNPFFLIEGLTLIFNNRKENLKFLKFSLQSLFQNWEGKKNKNFEKKNGKLFFLVFSFLNFYWNRLWVFPEKLESALSILKKVIKKTRSVKYSFVLSEFIEFLQKLSHSTEKTVEITKKIYFPILSKFKRANFFLDVFLLDIFLIKIFFFIEMSSKINFRITGVVFEIFFSVFSKTSQKILFFLKKKLNVMTIFAKKAINSKNPKVKGFGVFCLKNILTKIPTQKISAKTIIKVYFLGLVSIFREFRENCNVIILIMLIHHVLSFEITFTFFRFQDRCLYIKNSFLRFNSLFTLLRIMLLSDPTVLQRFISHFFYLSFLRFFTDQNKKCNFLVGFICKITFSQFSYRLFLVSLTKINQNPYYIKFHPFFLEIFFFKIIQDYSCFTRGIQVKFLLNSFSFFIQASLKNQRPTSDFRFFPEKVFFGTFFYFKWIFFLPFFLKKFFYFSYLEMLPQNKVENKTFLYFFWRKPYPENFINQKNILLNPGGKFCMVKNKKIIFFMDLHFSELLFREIIFSGIFWFNFKKKKIGIYKKILFFRKKKKKFIFYSENKTEKFEMLHFFFVWLRIINFEKFLNTKNFSFPKFFYCHGVKMNFDPSTLSFLKNSESRKFFFFLKRLKKTIEIFCWTFFFE